MTAIFGTAKLGYSSPRFYWLFKGRLDRGFWNTGQNTLSPWARLMRRTDKAPETHRQAACCELASQAPQTGTIGAGELQRSLITGRHTQVPAVLVSLRQKAGSRDLPQPREQ
jgi:hypothetical protein